MSRLTARKANAAPAHPPWWTVSEIYVFGNRTLTRGTGLKIRGERGATFRFWDHVTVPEHDGKPETEWITVTGGPLGVSMFRSFRPERITKVLAAPPRPERKRRKAGAA
jgi:hypothetical protein